MLVPLVDQTTDQAAQSMAVARVAILPLGAIEQHGPHLALNTDIAIATALAARIASGLGSACLLLPPVPYGLSEHHTEFAGTITLRPNTLIGLILDIAESMAGQGIPRIIIVNGHGGNVDAIRIAARQARRDLSVRIAHVMWAQVASDAILEEMGDRGLHNHACEIETSLAMELAPSLIREEPRRAVSEVELPPYTAPPSARIDLPLWFDELSPSGALGDPSRATVERGRRLADLTVSRTLEFARSFIEFESPNTLGR